MTHGTRLYTLLGLLIGIGGVTTDAYADTQVVTRGETEIHRMTVKLSDLFEGVPHEIDRDIAQAPAPCKKAVYDANVLNRLAQKYRLEWSPQNIADHVVLSSTCTRITTDNLREAVIKKIKSEGIRGDIDVALDNRALEIILPADQSPDFSLTNFSYDQASRRFRSEVQPPATSGSYNIPISGRVTVRQKIPVLAHRLEEGSVIAATDIEWISVPEDRINASVIQDDGKLVGREVRRDTNGGDILHSNDVMPVRYVKRGSLVTLRIETPFMSVTAQGKAMQDGTVGDVVRVTNTQSNRMIEGIVDGAGIVRIPTAQKLASAE